MNLMVFDTKRDRDNSLYLLFSSSTGSSQPPIRPGRFSLATPYTTGGKDRRFTSISSASGLHLSPPPVLMGMLLKNSNL
jgi:hypothetical protein